MVAHQNFFNKVDKAKSVVEEWVCTQTFLTKVDKAKPAF